MTALDLIVAVGSGLLLIVIVTAIQIAGRRETARRKLLPIEEQKRLAKEDEIWSQTWSP